MAKQANRQGREYWSKLVREYERRAPGSESQKAFADRYGVKVDTFRGWLYKVGRERTGKTPRARFVEVRPASAVAARDVEIEIDTRVTVRFAAGTDAKRIAEVVVALAASLNC